MYIYVNPSLPIHPPTYFPRLGIHTFGLYICDYFCFANKSSSVRFGPGGGGVGGCQVALAIKNLPANAGDLRDSGSIPGLGRSPRGGYGSPLQYSCLEHPMDRGAGRLQSIGLHRDGHDWSDFAHTIFLDSTRKWYYTIFVFLFLT